MYSIWAKLRLLTIFFVELSLFHKDTVLTRLFLIFAFLATALFSHTVEEKIWPLNQSFFDYLRKNNIPTTLLLELDEETLGSLKTIFAYTAYEEQRGEENELLHAVIPIGEHALISLFKADENYKVEIVPARYEEVTETLTVRIKSSLQQDIASITGNNKLSNELASIFNDKVDFRRDIRKDDALSVIYVRKVRMGKTWGSVHVKSAFLETNKRRHYAFFREEDESYYNEKGKALAGMFLKYPMTFKRISSGYQPMGRNHPVLGYVRPHLGTDFAASVGTPVKAVADGVVRFRGCQNSCASGYGKLVIIEHRNGYETRYAHLNSFAKTLRQGGTVKQGQVIAFSGETGIATGPHLHFELRKNGRTTNPLSIKSVSKDGLKGAELELFKLAAISSQRELDYIADAAKEGVVRLASLQIEE